jgi:hypothetical protein
VRIKRIKGKQGQERNLTVIGTHSDEEIYEEIKQGKQ